MELANISQEQQPKKLSIIQEDTILKSSNLKAIYQELRKPLPREAIQEAQTQEFKGYNTIGFAYQFIVNRLNDVLGIEHWRIIEETIDVKQVGKMWEITKKLILQIGNFINTERKDYNLDNDGKMKDFKERNITEFEILVEKEAYGGHSAKLLADAHKGAYTNGLKKAAAMFGVGREAYEATLDEDNRNVRGIYEDLPEEKQKKVDEKIMEIQQAKNKKELEETGKKIREIKNDRNLIIILRSEYNKRLLELKKEQYAKQNSNSSSTNLPTINIDDDTKLEKRNGNIPTGEQITGLKTRTDQTQKTDKRINI